jgi:pilus assembly protein CpaE
MAFVGAKGGCGATTAAVNVAAALCGMPKGGAGRSVILLDLDAPGGDAAAMLRLEPSYSLADLAANIHRLDLSLLTSMTMRHASGLHILAAANEGARPGPVGEEQLAAIVAFLRDHFDDVVLAGGALDRSHVAAVSQAHLVHLVTTLDFLSLRRAKTIMARLRDLCVSGETVRVVVNRLDRTPDLKLGDVRQALGEPVAWTIPLDAATVEHAVNEGVPFATSGRGRIQAAYAKYVEGLGNGPQGPRGPHRSDGPHGEEEPRLRMGLLRRLIPGRAGAAS